MSDEEHHFESSDAGASKTYPQQAGTIRKNGYIVIKGRPCKVSFPKICSSDLIRSVDYLDPSAYVFSISCQSEWNSLSVIDKR